MISAHDVEHAAFGRAKAGKSGYDEGSVDDFLDRVVETLTAIEGDKHLPHGAVTSTDVVEAVFSEKDSETDGGYDLDEVDDLLDRVAQRLFEYEKQHGGARQVSEAAGAGAAGGAVAHERGDHDERADFRDEPAAPELQDSSRSWDEEPGRMSRDEHVARDGHVDPVKDGPVAAAESRDSSGINPVGGTATGEAAVEQYPATDHRVPLPRQDVSSQLSDDDLRAQENYHPEYSEYDTAAAPRAESRAPEAEEPATAQHTVRVVASEPDVAPERDVAPASDAARPVQAGAPSEPSASGAPSQAETPQNTIHSEARPAAEPQVASSDSTVADAPGRPAASNERSTPTQAETTGVARPEQIERPEPIDRPRELPKRDDRSRKGFLRRIFKG